MRLIRRHDTCTIDEFMEVFQQHSLLSFRICVARLIEMLMTQNTATNHVLTIVFHGTQLSQLLFSSRTNAEQEKGNKKKNRISRVNAWNFVTSKPFLSQKKCFIHRTHTATQCTYGMKEMNDFIDVWSNIRSSTNKQIMETSARERECETNATKKSAKKNINRYYITETILQPTKSGGDREFHEFHDHVHDHDHDHNHNIHFHSAVYYCVY